MIIIEQPSLINWSPFIGKSFEELGFAFNIKLYLNIKLFFSSKTNRCGLIIVCYLCRVRGIPLNDALEEFKNATDGVGIYRQVFIDKLYEKYSNNNEPKPICPSRPEWVTD